MASLGPILPCAFGRYTLVERVGAGGMATVYRALLAGEGGFEKEVAVKVVREELANDPQFRTLFLDEARVSARLAHANLVHTFDFGQVDGIWFLAMEYVRGRTLANLLRALRVRGLWPGTVRSLHLAAEVAKGLGHAHRLAAADGTPLGLVHRDVSPQNVLVSREGEVKLGDFGIAKAALSSHVTQPGKVRGKCAYMAPEQARGRPVDARADVFALGVVLWECLTGTALFDGGSDAEILLQVLQKEVVAPSRLRAEVPPEVDELVLRMLARAPALRPANGDEAARELAGLRLRFARSPADLDLAELDRMLRSGTAVQPAAAPPASVEVPIEVTAGATAGAWAGAASGMAMAGDLAAPATAGTVPDGAASAPAAAAGAPPARPADAGTATVAPARPGGNGGSAGAAGGGAEDPTAPVETVPSRPAGEWDRTRAAGKPLAEGPTAEDPADAPTVVSRGGATGSSASAPGPSGRATAGRALRTAGLVALSVALGTVLGVVALAAFSPRPEPEPATSAVPHPGRPEAPSRTPTPPGGSAAEPGEEGRKIANADRPVAEPGDDGRPGASVARPPEEAPPTSSSSPAGAEAGAVPPVRPGGVGGHRATEERPAARPVLRSRPASASSSSRTGSRTAPAGSLRPSPASAAAAAGAPEPAERPLVAPVATGGGSAPAAIARAPTGTGEPARLVVSSVLAEEERGVRIDGGPVHRLSTRTPERLTVPAGRRRVSFASVRRPCAVTVILGEGEELALHQDRDGAVARLEGTAKHPLVCE